MLRSNIVYCGDNVITVCDLKCEKAWGITNRPKLELKDDEDDYVYLADVELENAPDDPGTYEGSDGKPFKPTKHNKWCIRECERCVMFDLGEDLWVPDFSKRYYNIPNGDDKKNYHIKVLDMEGYNGK